MSFVKNAAEIARIEAALSGPRFVNAQMLTVDFLAEPEQVADLLPPPLRPSDAPRVTAMVGRWQSNCVGDFNGGAIYVAARHGELEGDYVLAMYMSSDAAIIYGRDLFGEPKKQSTSALFKSGDRMTGWVERNGVRLIHLEAELDTDHEPSEVSGANFNFKARPAANGVGLEEDAILTVATFDNRLRVNREGRGAVVLRGTAHDPLDELEVAEVIRGAYIEGDLIASCEAVASVPADIFLPYHYGRMDDWSLLDTERSPLPA